MTVSDMDLARDYAHGQSETAFATLVSRHINLVYSVAWRHVRDAHKAEEVTQVVFIILANKAGGLGANTILPAWLCRTARNVSMKALMMERRRHAREQEAYMQSTLNEPQNEAWKQIAPLLDDGMSHLSASDYNAIVLRFFDAKSFREVGVALGSSEDAAKKRVNRAIARLQRFFAKRGIVLSAGLLAGAVSIHSVQAAPVGLASTVASAIGAGGEVASGSALTLLQGTLKYMAWTKIKISIAVVVVAMFGAAATLGVMTLVHSHTDDAIWKYVDAKNPSLKNVNTLPQGISIRHASFGPKVGSRWMGRDKGIQMGVAVSMERLLQNAYGIRTARIIKETPLPRGEYDYIVTLTNQPLEVLQGAIRKKFGLTASKQNRETNVYVLKLVSEDAPGMKPSAQPRGNSTGSGPVNRLGNGQFELLNASSETLGFDLEKYMGIPVIDETGLTNRYDIQLKWTALENEFNRDTIIRTVREQLGVEMVPDSRAIEMLVIKKAN